MVRLGVSVFILKLGLLLFWGLWYLVVFSTNLCESFRALKILPRTWRLASGNLRAVTQAVNEPSTSRWLPRTLFFGVLCWQLLALSLFAWAMASSMLAGSLDSEAANAAFAAALGLWAAFILADEMLRQYDIEHPHVLFFIAQLVTLIALHVL
jgi:hypothetical protein